MKAQDRRLTTLLAFGAIVVGLTPWAISFFGGSFGFWHFPFQGTCHQMPERSLFFSGEQMVVCSRCAGLYAGMVLGAVTRIPPKLAKHSRWIVIFAAVPMVVDVLTQDLGLHEPWHPSRLGTGFLAGWLGVSVAMTALVREVRGSLTKPTPPTEPEANPTQNS